MPNLLSRWLGRAPDAKASRAPRDALAGVAFFGGGRAAWSARDNPALIREGVCRNAVVHRAVRLIAEAAAAVPLDLQAGGTGRDRHPLIDLLAAPNPRETGTRFLEGVYGHLVTAGNAYLEAVEVEGVPRELYALRPDRMRVVPGRDGWPEAYEYAVGSRSVRFAADGGEGAAPILHLTLFHPLDDHYGLAPIEAAAAALDIHNAASAWNKALLDNAARPSGALVFAGPAGASLSDPQFERLRAELEGTYAGAANAGRPLLLDGGLDWKPLSLSPKDMDFVDAKNAAAREIALAFGVPPLLLGLGGDNTHANYAEANRAFYRQAVIPLVRRTGEALARWLGPAFGAELRLVPDLDAIEALAGERESLWRRVGAATFLDEDEKREAVGYGRRRGEVGIKSSADQPRVPAGESGAGQWMEGGGGDDQAGSANPRRFADRSFGKLIAEIPVPGGRNCVYHFDFAAIVVPGAANFRCQGTVPSSAVAHGRYLNDNRPGAR